MDLAQRRGVRSPWWQVVGLLGFVKTRLVWGAVIASWLLVGCQQPDRSREADGSSRWDGFEPLQAMEEAPTYHVLEGYDRRWFEYVREGVEVARGYWGSFGPTHVWVLGHHGEGPVGAVAREAFLAEYCTWRTAGSDRTVAECLRFAEERLLKPAEEGSAEAYLSEVRDTDPHMAELIFINVHKWFYENDPVPDPVLRGIHEYTHVFQQSVGPIPTWMAEGGAVFAEAWLPALDGRHDFAARMKLSLRNAQKIRDTGLTIADMEEIESAPPEVARYHRELAYDAGAWATAFIVHCSSSRSVDALRTELFPLIKEVGWEAALIRYVGMRSKGEFYAAFGAFMALPLLEQNQVLLGLGR